MKLNKLKRDLKRIFNDKKRYDHQIKAHYTMDNVNGRKCDVEIQF